LERLAGEFPDGGGCWTPPLPPFLQIEIVLVFFYADLAG